MFRIAINNSRLEKLEHDHVTFRYRDNRSHQNRSATLPVRELLRRFLLHVLPDHFTKVRYYGLFSPRAAAEANLARAALTSAGADLTPNPPPPTDLGDEEPETHPLGIAPILQRCPLCQQGLLRLVDVIPRWRAPPTSALLKPSLVS